MNRRTFLALFPKAMISIAAMAGMVTVAGCAETDADGLATYRNDTYGFSIKYPCEYEKSISSDDIYWRIKFAESEFMEFLSRISISVFRTGSVFDFDPEYRNLDGIEIPPVRAKGEFDGFPMYEIMICGDGCRYTRFIITPQYTYSINLDPDNWDASTPYEALDEKAKNIINSFVLEGV